MSAESGSSGYIGAFQDFVQSNQESMPSTSAANNDLESQSSVDTVDSDGDKQVPSCSNVKTEKKRKRDSDTDDSDDENDSDSANDKKTSAESDDSEPPAVPKRPRTQRTAKQKVLSKMASRGRGRGRGQVGAQNDSDSDDSDDVKRNSEEEEDDDDGRTQRREGSDYDSDKDPAWRPAAHKSPKRTRKTRSAASDSDDSVESPSSSRGRGRGRGRGQGPGRGRGGRTLQASATITTVASAPAAATTTTTTIVSATTTATTTAPATTTSGVAMMPPRRGRGRPSTFGPMVSSSIGASRAGHRLPDVVPATSNASEVTYFPDLNPPHNFQKGEFVIDRRDWDNYRSFPIWKIDSPRLLQKYEAFEQDGRLLHRSVCTYSSWPGHTQHSYSAISIRYLSSVRGKEVVEVYEKYRPRPLGVRDDELESLREAFIIYTQILISQALEPSFIVSLQQEPDPYYMTPLGKVDRIICERKLAVQGIYTWNAQFLETASKYPSFNLTDVGTGEDPGRSEATESKERVTKLMTLYGAEYNHDTLQQSGAPVEQSSGYEYRVTSAESIVMTVYHGLQHYKMNLCQKCTKQVNELKARTADMEDHVVLDNCLRNQTWMQQMFSQLTRLLEHADKISGR